MGPETDIVEPVLAGRRLAVCLSVCLAGMFVREICLGMYGESSILILM